MKKGFFITGTDTGVGKTFVTAGILKAMFESGDSVCPMKPVETGCCIRKGRLIPADALKLLDASGEEAGIDLINPYRFRLPLAPLAAAEAEGITISKRMILSAYKKLSGRFVHMLVEGAGGIMAPINQRYLMVDLINDLGLPLIIVARPGLGTINHTLLSVDAARSRGIDVRGVIINNAAGVKRDGSTTRNPEIIEKAGRVDVIDSIPFYRNQDSAGLAKKFTLIARRIFK